MITYHIDNWFTKQVVEMDRYNQLSDDDHLRLYSEIKNATLQGLEKKFQQVWDDFDPNNKIENKVQSLLLWVLGYTDDKPTSNIEIKSMGSYADIDTDVDANADIDVERSQMLGGERQMQTEKHDEPGDINPEYAEGNKPEDAIDLAVRNELCNVEAKAPFCGGPDQCGNRRPP